MRATLLMDDRAGRTAAAMPGLPVVGTAGLLIQAKGRGLVPAVLPLLQTIRSNGYRFTDALLAAAAKLAGE